MTFREALVNAKEEGIMTVSSAVAHARSRAGLIYGYNQCVREINELEGELVFIRLSMIGDDLNLILAALRHLDIYTITADTVKRLGEYLGGCYDDKKFNFKNAG